MAATLQRNKKGGNAPPGEVQIVTAELGGFATTITGDGKAQSAESLDSH